MGVDLVQSDILLLKFSGQSRTPLNYDYLSELKFFTRKEGRKGEELAHTFTGVGFGLMRESLYVMLIKRLIINLTII